MHINTKLLLPSSYISVIELLCKKINKNELKVFQLATKVNDMLVEIMYLIQVQVDQQAQTVVRVASRLPSHF